LKRAPLPLIHYRYQKQESKCSQKDVTTGWQETETANRKTSNTEKTAKQTTKMGEDP
jgi:hypothetical protein